MPSREPRERFTLTIQDAGDRHGVPIAPRLRRLLKAMLRGYGVRCLSILPATDTRPNAEPHRNTAQTYGGSLSK